ncbi:MAG TPA: NAD(P)-dependent oxidoreductase [Candidatus Choladousia intestinigallinarum]|nr:NAD(P)-dependent oxidoreductase [Candidatus Choladousia intestinigallinarum]
MKRVGFIGLGNIGKGICSNLIKQGNELTVYDVYKPAMEQFQGQAYLAESPVDVLRRSDYVFLSLPKSEIVEETVHAFIQEGVKDKMIIDTSTSYPISTKKLFEEVKAAGGAFVDAPLMAGPDEAAAGTLDIVVGGDKEDYDNAKELFDAYCQSYKYVGPSGTGHLIKLAINFISLTEALMFAQLFPLMDKMGFDPKDLFEVFEDSVLKNWTSTFYTKKYMDREYKLDFALALGTKDLSYVKRMYEEYNVPAFVLDGALDFCRVALAEQEKGQPPIDMSYPCETMYHLLGMK